MDAENGGEESIDNDHVEEGSPGMNETDEAVSSLPLSVSSERIERLAQEEQEEVDIAKESYELERELEQRPDRTRKIVAPNSNSKGNTSLIGSKFDSIDSFQDQLKWQIHRTEAMEDKVNAIQKKLVQINKTNYTNIKEHPVVRKIEAQLRLLQKSVDTMNTAIGNPNRKSGLKRKFGRKKLAVRKSVKRITKKI